MGLIYLSDNILYIFHKFHIVSLFYWKFHVYKIINKKNKKEPIQMERRAEDIIRGRSHTPTRIQYAEREKRISAIIIINNRGNRSNL